MKISKKQKFETRLKIINAACELFVEQGFDKTTMKQIAREAGIGDATIYKYFPNKEKLITGFYEVRGQQALEIYQQLIEDDDYNFEEHLQLLVDTFLEQLLADREFVQLSLGQFVNSPLSLLKDRLAIVADYKTTFMGILDAFNDSNPETPIPATSMTASLLTDCLFGILIFWIKDDSEEFSNTQQLSQLCISLFSAFIRSGLINKLMDIVSFIIKTQLLRVIENGAGVISLLQGLTQTMKHR